MNRKEQASESVAIIDARKWQNQFDLRTGDKSEKRAPLIDFMKEVLHRHHYPGDADPGCNAWVTDTALDLLVGYRPGFAFLTYGAQYFAGRVELIGPAQRRAMMDELFLEVERFIAESGFTPVIVGRGGVMQLVDVIDLSDLDGICISTHWSARYAGLHAPSAADLQRVAADPNITRIVPANEFRELFGDSVGDGPLVPDYLLVARRGYAFKALGCSARKPAMIPDAAGQIPFFSTLGEAAEITSIRGVVDRGLRQGRKIAFIMLEGVGMDDFPWASTPCGNGRGWFSYEPSDAQHLAITTGRHRILEHPPGYLFHAEESKEYPLSGYFKEIPSGTIGAGFPGKSIAVGNKSMDTHMLTGADLCIECFARNHYNQGTLGVLHRPDKF